MEKLIDITQKQIENVSARYSMIINNEINPLFPPSNNPTFDNLFHNFHDTEDKRYLLLRELSSHPRNEKWTEYEKANRKLEEILRRYLEVLSIRGDSCSKFIIKNQEN
jgi:hypothetical protein